MAAMTVDRLPGTRRILWVRVTSDLTVGNVEGSYVGCIDRVRDGTPDPNVLHSHRGTISTGNRTSSAGLRASLQ